MSEEQSSSPWPLRQGDELGYGAMHKRAATMLPNVCVSCGAKARLECALLKTAPAANLRTSIIRGAWDREGRYARTQTYSIDPHDYSRLCHRCHKAHMTRAIYN